MRKINSIEGFDAESAAIQVSSSYHDGDTIMALPADVRKAWFRIKYPQGHCEDEPFGICNETVANVKVTVYATGDHSQELAHAYASRTVIPETVDSRIPKESLQLHLYKAAVGMAKATALMEAGIGMGYYQSIDDFNNETNECLNPVLEKRLRNEPEPVRADRDLPASVSAPAATDSGAENAQKTRRNAAAVAEDLLRKIEESVNRICELSAGMKQDGITPSLLKSMQDTAAKEKKTLATMSADLTGRIQKAVKNGNDDVLKVVSFDALNAVLQRLPEDAAPEDSANAEIVTEAPDEAVPVTAAEPEDMASAPEPEEVKADSENGSSDYVGYVPTSDVIANGNIGGKALSEYSETEIKFILGKAAKGILNDQDTVMAVAALKGMYPSQVELCRGRFPNIGI